MMPLNAAQSQLEFFQFPFLDSLWRPLIRIFEPKSVSFGPQSQIENLQFPFLQRAADQRLICSTLRPGSTMALPTRSHMFARIKAAQVFGHAAGVSYPMILIVLLS